MDEKPTAREFHRANVFFESGNCASLPTHGAPLPQQRPTANNLRAHYWQQQVHSDNTTERALETPVNVQENMG